MSFFCYCDKPCETGLYRKERITGGTNRRPAISTQEKWRIARGCRLLWQAWDNEYVIYNAGSGSTHLLDMPSGEILKLIEQQPLDINQLAEKLEHRTERQESDPINCDHIKELLGRFQEIGLIEPE